MKKTTSKNQEILKRAVREHSAGQLPLAENLYRSILLSEPKNVDANHNLGVLLLSLGRKIDCIPYLKLAFNTMPKNPQFSISYIYALFENEQMADAKGVFEAAKKNGLNGDVIEQIEKRISLPSQLQINAMLSNHSNGKLQLAVNQAQDITNKYPDYAFGWMAKGFIFADMGNLFEAELSYREAIRLQPDYAEAYSNLGNLLKNLGRLAEAESCYREALVHNPNFPDAHSNLGSVLRDLGLLADSVTSCREAIRLMPDLAAAHYNLSCSLLDLGNLLEAEKSCRNAIRLKPNFAEAYSNLGILFKELGNFGQAEMNFREAIRLKPNFAEAYCNLGIVLRDIDQARESIVCFRQSIRLKPDYSNAYFNLGIALKELGYLPEAEANYREALRINPEFVDAHSNLGIVLRDLGRREDAVLSFREAIRIKPDFAKAYSNLGSVLQDLGHLKEAADNCREAIRIEPDFAEAYSNLGNVLRDMGCLAEGADKYREAIRLKPDFSHAYPNLLFLLNYDERLSAEEVFQVYEAYGAAQQSKTKMRFEHGPYEFRGERRIRIGYSSADFMAHACYFFMEPLFRNHDRNAFELYAYSNVVNPDAITERLKPRFDHWVDVRLLNDEQMAKRIFDDKIDILVDLAGHTKGNRLPVFAMHPARIQITYIGYGYTTGLREIDYFFGDKYFTPPGSEAYFSEKIWRLDRPPVCYQPPEAGTPDVGPLPALKNGYITFGSLSRIIRINDQVLKVWGQILARVPNSRLRLDQKPFLDEKTRELFYKRLEGLGVAKERVDLTCTSPHWCVYNEIDITLDCFPHNAGTTTFESLWMGVPVLSKLDRPSVGRFGAFILNPVGLESWLAESESEYIDKAVTFAGSLESLAELRATLRCRLQASELMNDVGMTRALENAYRKMITESAINS